MANLFFIYLGIFVLVAIFLIDPLEACTTRGLKVGFYDKTCPSAEAIVKSAVDNATLNDSGAPAALIRLHFHDCFVRGCDASILLDSLPGKLAEKDSSANLGIGGFDIIDEAKTKIESLCPNTVSCADIIAFAARDSVSKSGGLHYAVPAGRRDGRISLSNEASTELPASSFNVTQLKENFARKGLSLEEMVTLSGAHSIGDSHCSAFAKRLYAPNSTMDPSYASYLKTKCPRNGTLFNTTVVPNDPVTPRKLDNQYYDHVKNHKALLGSDQSLWDNALTRKMAQRDLHKPKTWAREFAAAMVQMGSIDVVTGMNGEIRKNCRVVN